MPEEHPVVKILVEAMSKTALEFLNHEIKRLDDVKTDNVNFIHPSLYREALKIIEDKLC